MLDYFGFREDPFGVTPDPSFLYESLGHRQAFASITNGIAAGRGFMALIAEPGLGKTTLLFKLLEHLQQIASTVFLFQTQCTSRELLAYLLTDLNIDISDKDVVQMHLRLNEALAREAETGRRCVVVIDEAQDLDPSVLETVRLLSNFETPRSKLLQIILAGQPALADRLSEERLKQLRQRLSSVSTLRPLQPPEVGRYIAHRLQIAGYNGAPLFEAGAEAAIAEYSGGVPRNINNICFNSLSICRLEGRKQVNREIVQQVVSDLELRPSLGEVGAPLAKERVNHNAGNGSSETPEARASPVPWSSAPQPAAIPPLVTAVVPVEIVRPTAPQPAEVPAPPVAKIADKAEPAQRRQPAAVQVTLTRSPAAEEKSSTAQRLSGLLGEAGPVFANQSPAQVPVVARRVTAANKARTTAGSNKKKREYGWLVALGIVLALSVFLGITRALPGAPGIALRRIGSDILLWDLDTITLLHAQVGTILLYVQIAIVVLIAVLFVYCRLRVRRSALRSRR